MVSADIAKELQNVLPKSNPFPAHIRYDVYRAGWDRRWQTHADSRTLTSH